MITKNQKSRIEKHLAHADKIISISKEFKEDHSYRLLVVYSYKGKVQRSFFPAGKEAQRIYYPG